MSNKPKSIFPPSLGRATQTTQALKADMTDKEREELEEALRFARGEIEAPSAEEQSDDLDGPNRSEWPECIDWKRDK